MRSDNYSRLILVTVLWCCPPAFAWGPDGHSIVALIATARLTPAAATAVKALLGNATLADVSSWADQIKRDRPETSSWHYVDIPVDAAGFDEKRDGNDDNNVVDAIEYYEKYVADRTKPMPYRVEALKFLVHFVGDIHQPLHCADRHGDRGGNGRLVFFLDQPRALNLHSVWDSSIIQHEMGTTSVTVFASALNARISAQQALEWSKGTPVDWANESHALAVSVVYAGVPTDGPPPKLGVDYVKRGEDTVNQQLEKGGVRLATILNEDFK
jgi:hypothetical protein